MPAKYFVCSSGKEIEIAKCLEHCDNPQGRCLSLPTLYAISYDRTWQGKASTTQLLNPTRLAYLKITQDYAIIPKTRAFSLLGTAHHHLLDVTAKKIEGIKSEKRVENLINSGILDLLEPDELQDGFWKLTDYKTWGSYATAKILNKDSYERLHASLQLNDYRLKVEAIGFNISQLSWQITIRDGGTWIAKNNNILDTMLLIPADKLDDDFVIDYFYQKNKLLIDALNNSQLPSLCNFEERWNGNRCKGSFCEVHMFCPEGAQINKVQFKELK